MEAKDVLHLVFDALSHRVANIKGWDVTMGEGVDKQDQVVLTTDNGTEKQEWILDAESILEADEGTPLTEDEKMLRET